MDISDRNALRQAIERLKDSLRISVPADLLDSYLRGDQMHLPGYEKVVGEFGGVPVIIKSLLVAESYIAQPAVGLFYDIFRTARVVPLLRRLDGAVKGLAEARVAGHQERFRRLADASDHDTFDAILFELAVCARYGEVHGLDRVAFIPERSDRQSPDIQIRTSLGEQFVECKRLDRMTDASAALRNEARDVCQPTLGKLRREDASAVVEIRFASKPSETAPEELAAAALTSLSRNTSISIPGARVFSRPLLFRRLENYQLFPSAQYFAERYGYSSRGWHGVIPAMMAKMAGPSFLDEVGWEAAILWRTDDEEAIWKMKRLAFTTLFKGLEQLEIAGRESVLHIWYERNLATGHRQEQLAKLVDTLRAKRKDRFSWIVANETVSDVSIEGRFDFQEHPTLIPGASAAPGRPSVEHVFVGKEDLVGIGAWGIGVDLPSLDEKS